MLTPTKLYYLGRKKVVRDEMTMVDDIFWYYILFGNLQMSTIQGGVPISKLQNDVCLEFITQFIKSAKVSNFYFSVAILT